MSDGASRGAFLSYIRVNPLLHPPATTRHLAVLSRVLFLVTIFYVFDVYLVLAPNVGLLHPLLRWTRERITSLLTRFEYCMKRF